MRRWIGMMVFWLFSSPAMADEALWQQLREGGYLLLMRHAQTVPGTGDPPGFRLDDCATQRNLSEEGKAQARRTGEAFRQRGVRIDAVRASAWCRCTETAQLAFGQADKWPALNSFFESPESRERQTEEVRRTARTLSAPQNWMLVTHQVNITALTGDWPASGEIIVVKPVAGPDGHLPVVGKLRVP